MSTTLILFDVDGTLIDPAGVGRAAVHDAFRDVFGVTREALEGARVRFAGRTDPRIFRSLAEALSIAPAPFHARHDRLVDAYVEHLRRRVADPASPCRVLPGIHELIDALGDRRDVRLGLLTGNLERGARVKLEPFDLNRHFPAGGFASDDEDRREIARIARDRLARHHGLDSARCRTVVVGDTELDVDCAHANGFRSVAVGTGGATAARMASWDCDAWLADLGDTSAALAAIGLDATPDPRRT